MWSFLLMIFCSISSIGRLTGVDQTVSCNKDEEFQQCWCEVTCCNELREETPCSSQCHSGCFCKGNLVRNNDYRCIDPQECDRNSCGLYPAVCPQNEVISDCVNLCNFCDSSKSCQTTECKRGCDCIEGFTRINNNGRCIPKPTCPTSQRCREEEELLECGPTCQATCTDRTPTCTEECKRGCFCKKGLIRDDTGECIHPNQCPTNVAPSTLCRKPSCTQGCLIDLTSSPCPTCICPQVGNRVNNIGVPIDNNLGSRSIPQGHNQASRGNNQGFAGINRVNSPGSSGNNQVSAQGNRGSAGYIGGNQSNTHRNRVNVQGYQGDNQGNNQGNRGNNEGYPDTAQGNTEENRRSQNQPGINLGSNQGNRGNNQRYPDNNQGNNQGNRRTQNQPSINQGTNQGNRGNNQGYPDVNRGNDQDNRRPQNQPGINQGSNQGYPDANQGTDQGNPRAQNPPGTIQDTNQGNRGNNQGYPDTTQNRRTQNQPGVNQGNRGAQGFPGRNPSNQPAPENNPGYSTVNQDDRGNGQGGIQGTNNSRNTTGIRCSGEGEVYSECGSACPANCENYGRSYACTQQCVQGCFCQEDLVRSEDGRCIDPSECPEVMCPENEEYSNCISPCNDCTYKGSCNVDVCNRGCDCIRGYFRGIYNRCVPESSCASQDVSPTTEECDLNESYYDCKPTCRNTCETYGLNIVCPRFCNPGCECIEGYTRRSDGVCIPKEQCTSQEETTRPILGATSRPERRTTPRSVQPLPTRRRILPSRPLSQTTRPDLPQKNTPINEELKNRITQRNRFCGLEKVKIGSYKCTMSLRGTICEIWCGFQSMGNYNCGSSGADWNPSLPSCVKPKDLDLTTTTMTTRTTTRQPVTVSARRGNEDSKPCRLKFVGVGKYNCTVSSRGAACHIHCNSQDMGIYQCKDDSTLWTPSLPSCVKPKDLDVSTTTTRSTTKKPVTVSARRNHEDTKPCRLKFVGGGEYNCSISPRGRSCHIKCKSQEMGVFQCKDDSTPWIPPLPPCVIPRDITICSPNEEYHACTPSCRNSCKNLNNPSAQCSCGPPGCFCKNGLVKRETDGKCVLPTECTGCPQFQEFYKCMPECSNRCNPLKACSPVCRPGCFCRRDLVINSRGQCIRPEFCASHFISAEIQIPLVYGVRHLKMVDMTRDVEEHEDVDESEDDDTSEDMIQDESDDILEYDV